MRQALLLYDATIYDTNCIIFICYPITIQRRGGGELVIDEGQAAQLARDLTSFLQRNRKTIRTIQAAYHEVGTELIATIVNKRISDHRVREEVGLGYGEEFPKDMRLRIAKKLRRNINRLQGEPWFRIDGLFHPDPNRMRLLRSMMSSLLTVVPAITKQPSDVDLALIIYSGYTSLPLVSNDTHITRFASQLENRGFAKRIVPLALTSVSP